MYVKDRFVSYEKLGDNGQNQKYLVSVYKEELHWLLYYCLNWKWLWEEHICFICYCMILIKIQPIDVLLVQHLRHRCHLLAYFLEWHLHDAILPQNCFTNGPFQFSSEQNPIFVNLVVENFFIQWLKQDWNVNFWKMTNEFILKWIIQK